jgi:adenylate kinase family enzyme
MVLNYNDFFLSNKDINLINKWINKDYKKQFLFIHGKDSSGKTSLSEYILNKYKIIHINIDFFKEKVNIKQYIDEALGRKNILMMFNKDYEYNAIVFDNLELFLKHNKPVLNEIISYISKLNIHKERHPIIFISSNINHKYFKKILSNSKFIEINYSYKNILSITDKILLKKNVKLSEKDKENLIKKSDHKINNIISNIEILKLNDNKNDIFNYEDTFINDSINKIYNSKDFEDIIRYSQNTNNLYFDILDNIHFITKDLQTIKNIYKTSMIAENVNTYYIKNHLNLYDFYIILSIIYPKYYLNNKIKRDKIINNKYISKSLIYISNNRHIYNNNLNINILYLINKLKEEDEDFINFIKEQYNIYNPDIKKLTNTYDKIIKFD